jgi:hypothetical protein
MSFDVKKFETTNYVDRIEEVPIDKSEPELKKLFTGKGKKVFKVKQLTGIELFTMREAVGRNKDLEGIVELLASQASKDRVDGVKKAFGMTDDNTPEDWVRRVHILKFGLVDPDLRKKHETVVKFGETFPVTFTTLTDKIIALTGQGKSGES